MAHQGHSYEAKLFEHLRKGDLPHVQKILRRHMPDIPPDARDDHGLTVFHVCLLVACGSGSAQAAGPIRKMIKLLREHGFHWHKKSRKGTGPVTWKRGKVSLDHRTALECAQDFARHGERGMAACSPALPPVVAYFLEAGQAQARELQRDGGHCDHDHHDHGHHPSSGPSQKQSQMQRKSQEELAVQAEMFAENVETACEALEMLVRLPAGASQRRKEASRSYAAQCASHVGVEAEELTADGNQKGLRLGFKRLDGFMRRVEQDDRAWHLLTPFLAYLEDATKGRPTRSLPVEGQAKWSSETVNGALSATLGYSHDVDRKVAAIRAHEQHEAELRQPGRRGRRKLDRGRANDREMFGGDLGLQYALDPQEALRRAAQTAAVERDLGF